MENTGKTILLSISLLVSNSKDTIKNCMESLSSILEKVPSELIIVDTGGKDGSIEIAKQYADLVVSFHWCNDFAKARNAGLERASGEWFLFLDDDEWFEDTEEIIHFFNSGEYLKYNSASYIVRNYENSEGSKWFDSSNVRMVRRNKNTKFISPIHEILDPILLPQKEFSCYVHHYGYAYKNEEERKKHSERNLTLLKKVLEDNEDDYRLLMQLAQEYRSIYKLKESIAISKKVINKINIKYKRIDAEIAIAGWNIRNVICMEILLDHKLDAYNLAKKYIKYDWINTVTKNNIYYILVELSLDLHKETESFHYIDQYMKTYNIIEGHYILQKVEAILEQNISYNEESRFNVELSGFKAATILKDNKKQRKFIQSITETGFYPMSEEDLKNIVLYLDCVKDEKILGNFYSTFMKYEEFKFTLLNIVQKEKFNIINIIKGISETYGENAEEINIIKLESLKNMLLSSEINDYSFDAIDKILREFIESNIEQYLKIYRKDIFFDEYEFYLPVACRFSNKIQYVHEEEMSELEKVKTIKDAAEIYPEMARFCKIYVKKMQEEAKAAIDEFFQLATQIKKTIKSCLASGDKNSAIQMAKQLHQLLPTDTEVNELINTLENYNKNEQNNHKK